MKRMKAEKCRDLIGETMVIVREMKTVGGDTWKVGERVIVEGTWRGKFRLADPTNITRTIAGVHRSDFRRPDARRGIRELLAHVLEMKRVSSGARHVIKGLIGVIDDGLAVDINRAAFAAQLARCLADTMQPEASRRLQIAHRLTAELT